MIVSYFFSDDCEAKEGTPCQNGVCLDSLCHCNDGYGGCSCQVPGKCDESRRPSVWENGANGNEFDYVAFYHAKNATRFQTSLNTCAPYCFQTRTSASTGRATCSLTVPTRWGVSRVRVSPDTSATDSIAKVRIAKSRHAPCTPYWYGIRHQIRSPAYFPQSVIRSRIGDRLYGSRVKTGKKKNRRIFSGGRGRGGLEINRFG